MHTCSIAALRVYTLVLFIIISDYSKLEMKGTKVQTLGTFLLCIQQKYYSLQ